MSTRRKYKGYIGVFRVDDDAGVIRGSVVNTKDTITFEGDTVPEAVKAFEDSVEDYLAFCKDLGEEPDRPYSGTFLVRVDPKTHRDLTTIARLQGVSLNRFLAAELTKVAQAQKPGRSSKTSEARGQLNEKHRRTPAEAGEALRAEIGARQRAAEPTVAKPVDLSPSRRRPAKRKADA